MELFMKYFSLDYRSPPSGMGQIIDTTQPEQIQSPWSKPVWNYTLVTYSGCGGPVNPRYRDVKFFESQEAEEQGWAGPVLEDIIQFLRDQGVTHVYDGELSYEEEGADDEGFFTLERWISIMRSYL